MAPTDDLVRFQRS